MERPPPRRPLGASATRRRLADGSAGPLHLLWQAGAGSPPAKASGPTGFFPRSGLASMRTGWERDGTWVGVRGGSNAVSHGQLELGGFVLEMADTRFVSDYGLDDYALPGYFAPAQRARYFRCSTAAASTLSRPGRNQPWDAVAPLTAPVRGADGSWRTTVDLTGALQVAAARRSFALRRDGRVTVTDAVRADAPTALRWAAHTEASVTLSENGRHAHLSRHGRTVAASLAPRTPGRFRIAAAPATPGGFSNAAFTSCSWTPGRPPATR